MGRCSFKSRIKAFCYAFAGIKYLFAKEVNAKIHFFAALLAIIVGFLLQISIIEWTVIILCIGIVISAEAMNTSIEAICDKVSPEFSELVKVAKDVAAGAVLILAICSVIIAVLIFAPKIIFN